MGKLSLNKGSSAQKNSKKKDNDKKIEKNKAFSESEELDKPKRRLRKLNRKQSSDQDFVPGHSEQQEVDDIENDPQDPQQQFQRFKRQDDDDIQKQKQENQKKLSQKKLKGNQQLGKFMQNMQKNEKPANKKSKQQPKVQANLFEMFKIQKLKKTQRQRTPSPSPQKSQSIQNDQRQLSEDTILMKTMQAKTNYYQEYQGNVGNNMSDNQLIEKAKKLSLQSAKKQKRVVQEDFVELNDFEFENLKPNMFNKQQKKAKQQQRPNNLKKTQTKKDQGKMSLQKSRQISSQHEDKKPAKKSAAKKNVSKKQPKEGPLADQYIAFTGQFQPYTKDELIQLCQKLGAQTPKSITKKTTTLLQGAYIIDHWKRRIEQDINTTSKSVQAKQQGVRIVANKDIDDFFIQKTGKSLQQHFRKDVKKLDGFVQKQKADDTNVAMDIQIPDKDKVIVNKQIGFGVLWTEKYKPQTLDQVIGQAAQIKQLRQWLSDWQDVVLKGNKKDAIPARGFLPSGTINSRAALLSGDPGLGKTTTARLLAQQLNYNVTEFNASDIRNKKGVQLLESSSYGINQGTRCLVKNLIIMDQVDGMSKGDRGGITQIIGMIKNTTVPIICICNDRQSQKIRSLAGHCFDIKFHKPDKRLIIKRLHEIVEKQGGKVSDLVLTRIVQTFQNDMRQILTYLQLMFKTKTSELQAKDISQSMHFSKDNAVMLTHFDATRKLLNRVQLNSMTVRQKLDCFFIDSSFVPIMIHENYIASMKKGKLNKKQFHKFVKATDGFVLADNIDTRIRKQQDWGLMPSFGFMTAVYPSQMVAQSLGFPQFPSWLGKFSSQRKHKRLLKQLRQTIHCESPSTMKSIRYGQAQILYQQINYLLKNDKVQQTLDMMQTYNLSPTTMNDVLLELQYNPQKNVLFPDVTTSTKTKLTKAFNRRHQQAKMKGKAKKAVVGAQPEHHKFNQILQYQSDDDFIVNDDEQENKQNQDDSAMIDQKLEKKVSKKGGKGGKKK